MTKTIKLTIFRFDDLDQELPAIQFDDGTWYFSAQAVCLFAELASKENASRWVKMNVPPQNRFDRLYRVSTALRLRATLAPNRRVKQSLELVQQSSKYATLSTFPAQARSSSPYTITTGCRSTIAPITPSQFAGQATSFNTRGVNLMYCRGNCRCLSNSALNGY